MEIITKKFTFKISPAMVEAVGVLVILIHRFFM